MERPKIRLTPASTTSRDEKEIHLAIERTVEHTLARHGNEPEYKRRNIQDPMLLRGFISTIIWDASTVCFQASNSRELFYSCQMNTRVVLNFDPDVFGTCLPVKSGKDGARWFSNRYSDEIRVHDQAGFVADSMPPVWAGGRCAFDRGIHPRCEGINPLVLCGPEWDTLSIRIKIADWCRVLRKSAEVIPR